ncbi:flagellar export protein FliJ [Alkaliphilus hydrothermalis]|uniref:Flagellar FliJ protein n=1 Tax=Alkaliphilus hydrothermalis TaxID=1482730 RepID=A0ABS2NL53_9FIRM|nr:flagellar FliJ protein [Alkaliphilus hydrothermalis]
MARRFSYRFETILNLKEKNEENEKNNLGIATKSLLQEEEHLTSLLQRRHEVASEIRINSQKKLQIRDLQHYALKLEFIDGQINQQRTNVNQWENKVDQCRLQLMEAKKQTKIFNRIKEKDFEDHHYMELKDEEMFIDQLVSFKAACK